MKTRKAQLKREKIVRSAAKVFNRRGYPAVTMAEIAAEAETFAGSIYYYFPSREDLVEEVLDLGIAQLAHVVAQTVKALPPQTRPIDRLAAATRAHFFAALERDEFVMAYWKIADQVPDFIRERQLKKQQAYGRFWSRLIKQAQDEGTVRRDIDARVISLILIGGRLFSITSFNQKGPLSAAEVADIFVNLTLYGIATEDFRGELRPGPVAPSPKTKPRPRKSETTAN